MPLFSVRPAELLRVTLLNVPVPAWLYACAELPLNVTVCVPEVKVPLLDQFPPSVIFRLFASSVPDEIVTPPLIVELSVVSLAVALALFTDRFPIAAVLSISRMLPAGVEAFPI